jgi:hypothetical protein
MNGNAFGENIFIFVLASIAGNPSACNSCILMYANPGRLSKMQPPPFDLADQRMRSDSGLAKQ